MKLFHILCDANEVRIPRWRLINRKYLYSSLYTTKLQNSNSNFHIFKVDKFNEAISHTMYKASRSQKSKMAAHKQGKLICELVYNVAAQFPRLRTCFLRLKNSAERFPTLCRASETTYISAGIQYSCAIPTAIPMFSRSRNSKKLLFIMCDASGRQNASRHLGFLT